MKRAEIKFLNYLAKNKDSIRGLTLLSVQLKIKKIQEKLLKIEKNIDLAYNYLMNKSVQLIKTKANKEFIDSTFNDMLITNDLKDLENTDQSMSTLIKNQFDSFRGGITS